MSGHAQGSTEYLIILSAVLVIAIVILALMGIFSQSGGDISTNEYRSFWQTAQPFGIREAIQSQSANITLVVVNNAPRELIISNITLGFTGGSGWVNNTTSLNFAAGQVRSVGFPVPLSLPNCSGRSGRSYLYNVTITYDDDPLTGKKQIGQLPLVVICQ